LIIRDLATGKGAVASAIADVPYKQPGAEPRLGPPLLLMPGKAATFIYLTEKSKLAAPNASSLVDFYPSNLNDNAPVIGDLPASVSSLLALVRYHAGNEEQIDPRISALLIKTGSANKFSLACSLISRKRQADDVVLLVKLSIGKLEPSDYTLVLTFENLATGAIVQTHLELPIK
jgi:hypothetical protein